MNHDLNGTVVVWFARVSQLHDQLGALEVLLDPRERERAKRFHFPEDRARFIIGRGLLRQGLRRYAPHLPETLELTYSSLGRPLLPPEGEPLRFSISHTQDIVALALTHEVQVGIDLEYLQPTLDLLELAERILSMEDFRTFQTFSRPEWQSVFYRTWTRKEAYLKARGEGIGTSLQAVSVSFGPESISSLNDDRDTSAGVWRLHLLPVPADYVGCLACDDAKREVNCFSVRMEQGGVMLDPLPA